MTDYSIFFIIAIAATGIGALLFLLSLFGLGEHDLDFDADSGGADVGLLSVKSGIGFFLGFGWGGVLAQGLGWGMAASIAAAAFTGILMFLIIGLSMRFIMSLKSDGTLNYETLKGHDRLRVHQHSRRPPARRPGDNRPPQPASVPPGYSGGEETLPAGTPVEVVSVAAGVVTVKPLH